MQATSELRAALSCPAASALDFILFCLFETGSHYAVQAGLELTFVAQAGLELTPILLPQPLKCWDYRREPPRPALSSLL